MSLLAKDGIDLSADRATKLRWDDGKRAVQLSIDDEVIESWSAGAVREVSASGNVLYEDIGSIVKVSSGSAVTMTVQPQSIIDWPANARIDLVRYGSGTVTLAAGGGVTINSKSSLLDIGNQYGAVSLVRMGSNEWLLIGDLA